MTKYQQHPLSSAFPAMPDEDYQALKDSIEDIGVQNPITLYEGMVVDGWHRYKAASELMVDCPADELDDTDPRAFVLAQNKARRHITQAQMALATAAVYQWSPVGNPTFAQLDTQCPIGAAPVKTTAELAQIAGVHQNTIKQAKVVQTKAAPEVAQAVKDGKIGLQKAVAIAKLPKEQQAAAIDKPLPKPSGKQAPSVAFTSTDTDDTPECFGPDEAELAALHAEDQKQIEALLRIAEADDKLKQALDENRLLLAKCRAAEAARDTAQRQAEQFRKDMLTWKRRAERAERKAA